MSEHCVPLHRESWGFWDRQRQVFGDQFKGMDDEWKIFDAEIEKMKNEMFTLKPMDFGGLGSMGKGFDDFGDFGDFGKSLTGSTTKSSMSSTSITTSSTSGGKTTSSSTSSTSSSKVTSSSSNTGGNAALAAPTALGIGAGGDDLMSAMMIKPERPIVADADGNKRLSLRFDCKQFKPEEITVKTINNKLMVHAKHTEESPGKKVYREFTRQYVLPDKIDPMALNSVLAADGVLSIEAPAPASMEAPRERLLPIKRL